MKVATFQLEGTDTVGVVVNGGFIDLKRAAQVAGDTPDHAFDSMLSFIASGDEGLLRAQNAIERSRSEAFIPLERVTLRAPIPRPTKNVFCLGRNYAEHAAESLRALGQDIRLPAYPNVFTKAVTSMSGPYDDIPFDPNVSANLTGKLNLV